ncbi:universal stress protein [Halocatena pleomorpha]|uniref:Universal stress protein n=1 Tax=Halocatena pleomorpha TaxID=1785090 RepID=A0A3P3R3F0_9EURY|nr:universal stress protein [Halocatena pleomorpha]RRJ27875.1 universal stress protein [Halocatena pleomorpha]
MFETVVVATDGSESTERAVEASFDLSDRFDAELHALTVVESNSAAAHNRAQELLRDLADRADRTVTTVIEDGAPATAISSYATRIDADVVIMGIRGRDGPYRYHLGSVAETVVYECPVPVLTVHHLDGGVDEETETGTETE